MALDFNNARLLLWLRANKIALGNVLTVGRLGVFLSPELLASDASKFGVAPALGTWAEAVKSDFCEPVLMAMGASSVRALDYSDYEGATVLHDLNKPLPSTLEGCCDLLMDSGSLEHVFNVHTALDSYVKLVRPGGWIVLDMPADGCCGHGFYQFSPELFYQYFDGRVDCKTIAMFAVEDEPLGKWYSIPSPASLGDRVYLHGKKPLHVYVIVRRLEVALSESRSEPVQVDYSQAWNGGQQAPLKERGQGLASEKSITGIIRSALMKWMPIAYWRWSVIRNVSRKRRPFVLNVGDKLKRVDPFTTRLTF